MLGRKLLWAVAALQLGWSGRPGVGVVAKERVDTRQRRPNGMERPPSRPLVGVCVTGMPGRMIPEDVLDKVVRENPERDFFLVYVLEQTAQLYFSKKITNAVDGSSVDIAPSRFWNSTAEEIRTALLGMAPRNADLSVLEFVAPRTEKEWRSALGLPDATRLDALRLHLRVAAHVFNMYQKQVLCAAELLRYTETQPRSFELIVNTREDAVVIGDGPVRLDEYAERLRTEPDCGMISKSCNAWNGVSMRFQIHRPTSGMLLLSRRLHHIKGLYESQTQVLNAESFEAEQLRAHQVKWCPVSVTALPVTAGRIWDSGATCIPEKELRTDCVPEGVDEWLKTRRCEYPNGA